jgi:hypothetical protein
VYGARYTAQGKKQKNSGNKWKEGKKWESFRISKFGNGLKISR